MDVLYESMVGSISGFGTSNSKQTKRIVELQSLIEKAQRDIEALQKKIRTEKQFNRQMELNTEARALKKKVAVWQKELEELRNV